MPKRNTISQFAATVENERRSPNLREKFDALHFDACQKAWNFNI